MDIPELGNKVVILPHQTLLTVQRLLLLLLLLLLCSIKVNIFSFITIPLATVRLLNTELGELHIVAGSRFDTDKFLSESQSAYRRILKNMRDQDLFNHSTSSGL
jgi:hypothetical protein